MLSQLRNPRLDHVLFTKVLVGTRYCPIHPLQGDKQTVVNRTCNAIPYMDSPVLKEGLGEDSAFLHAPLIQKEVSLTIP